MVFRPFFVREVPIFFEIILRKNALFLNEDLRKMGDYGYLRDEIRLISKIFVAENWGCFTGRIGVFGLTLISLKLDSESR